jgi:2-iminobutanoate/2-iminopropanoate deaminase
MDPDTESIPDSPDEQARLVFENLDALLEVGGAGRGDVAHVTVFLTSNEHRALLNEQWLAWYPDPLDRPARHVIVGALPQNVVIQLEVVAAIDAGG